MTQQNILEVAKQGNPRAITALMNRFLKSKGITVKVALKDSCLHVMLEAAHTPNKQALIPLVRQRIADLEVETIKTVRVYGRQIGREFSAWIDEFTLIFDARSSEPVASVTNPVVVQDEPIPKPTPTKPETIPNYLPTITSAEVKHLGAYLVEAELLSEAQVEVALADQRATGVRFGEILVARGWLKQKTIEYLMEKIILPERESANRASPMAREPTPSQPIKYQEVVHQDLLEEPASQIVNDRETLIIDNLFTT
ncbi:MAG: hypothetical protein KME08_10695 [Aphanothece sp. CMT-3BRIN-NPC111]|jgi:hypothetical protein|nr:hypothetical protein [Aphanothece sp. CMT-3BRIN-NPC111]